MDELNLEGTFIERLPPELKFSLNQFVMHCAACERMCSSMVALNGACFDCRIKKFLMDDKKHNGAAALTTLVSVLGWAVTGVNIQPALMGVPNMPSPI